MKTIKEKNNEKAFEIILIQELELYIIKITI